MKILVTLVLLAFIAFIQYLWPILLIIALYTLAPKVVHSFSLLSSQDRIQRKITISSYQKKAYLASPQWQTIRKQTLARDKHTCQSCFKDDVPLDVHHIHYETFQSETGEELISLCRECHSNVHNQYGYNHNSYFPITMAQKLERITL